MLGPRAGIALKDEIEMRPDVLVYTTDKFDKEIEITGLVKLVLHVSTDVPNTDFTAKLVDVHPDGRAYNISNGILRNTFADQKQPVAIEIKLWPTSILIKTGHKIRLEISSSDFPRFDRNPNTGRPIATETKMQIANQIIYHNQKMPSPLILPIIPR